MKNQIVAVVIALRLLTISFPTLAQGLPTPPQSDYYEVTVQETTNGQIVAYTPFDPEDNPRWTMNGSVWIDTHSDRDTFEKLVPSVALHDVSESLWETFSHLEDQGTRIFWDPILFAYRIENYPGFESGSVFWFTGLGSISSGTFASSDVENGFSIITDSVTSEEFEYGEVGLELIITTSITDPINSSNYFNPDYNLNSKREILKELVNNYPHLDKGIRLIWNIMHPDLTDRYFISRPELVSTRSIDTYAAGSTPFDSYRTIIVRTSANRRDDDYSYSLNSIFGLIVAIDEEIQLRSNPEYYSFPPRLPLEEIGVQHIHKRMREAAMEISDTDSYNIIHTVD